ncbi:kelch repeat-containing protein [Sorangium sp. KYC3313]|uniref:kelch repeat-containing protein n=1 Tax=Sorangium sp. KYC3313 TaxID=3449740 RepID=UPI003F886836
MNRCRGERRTRRALDAWLSLALAVIAWTAGCARPDAGTANPGAEQLAEARLRETAPAALEWVAVPPMSAARVFHTATRLLDGRVLVAGGEPMSSFSRYDDALSSAELYDPATGTWTAAASMGSARSMHTATLLSNGKVLVVGGSNGAYGSVPLATAEVYDPAANVWTAVPPMDTPRLGHTTTPLPDGRVLVAGGTPTGSALHAIASCAIYDPALNAWSAGGSMHRARSSHEATLLLDGKVLVSGGYGRETDTTTETYDPVADAWTPGAPMLSSHMSHAGMLLPGGEVLLLDRIGWGIDQIYSPATGAWRFVSSSGWDARFDLGGQHALLLADGRALMTGGITVEADSCGTISCEPFPPSFFFYDTVGIYDVATDSWSMGPGMNGGRGDHTATLLLDGTVLVTGGTVYADEAWTFYATNGVERLEFAVVPGAPCGSSLDCGGRACAGAPVDDGAPCDDGNACTRADACQSGACAGADPVACAAPADACQTPFCDPATGRCEGALAPWGAPCDDGTACTQGETCDAGACVGKTSVVCEASAPCRASACDAATGACVESARPDGAPCDDGDACTLADACQAGACAGAPEVCPVRSSCFAPGACVPSSGFCPTSTPLPDGTPCPDPTSSAWAPAAPVPDGLYDAHSSTLLPDGTVLIAGGEAPTPEGGRVQVDRAVRYDPASDTWTPTGAMLHARARPTATLLPDGTVLVAGGAPVTAAAERYDPATGAWSAAAPMNVARRAHAAVLLPNGNVLVVGGFDGSSSERSAEQYDPVADTWTFVARMSEARAGLSATPLVDGRVLVVGGSHSEVYDPSNDAWTTIPMRSWNRYHQHSATRLADGRVLAVSRTESGSEYPVQLFDPSDDTWRVAAPAHCVAPSAVLLADDRVLVVRCWSDPRRDASAVQLYEPESDTWSLVPSLAEEPGVGGLVGLADGRVLLTATCRLGGPDCRALLYAPGDTAPGDGTCERGVCMPEGGGAGGAGGAGGDAPGAGGGTSSAGSGAGDIASGAGGSGVASSAQGSSGASTPGGDGDAGGCSTARLPARASAAPWLLLLALLGARRAPASPPPTLIARFSLFRGTRPPRRPLLSPLPIAQWIALLRIRRRRLSPRMRPLVASDAPGSTALIAMIHKDHPSEPAAMVMPLFVERRQGHGNEEQGQGTGRQGQAAAPIPTGGVLARDTEIVARDTEIVARDTEIAARDTS